jgi:exonuclease SbcC
MQLRHLELDNFLSHEKEQISFPAEGITFLDGASGAGKSSFIVDAVGYALFGAKATRARQDELRNVRHADEQMRVRADFQLPDGSMLCVERGLNAKGHVFARAFDGQTTLLAEGAQPVERLVRQRLGGLSWQQFYAAYVARQSEIDALVTANGSRRREIVHRMLGVREIELAEKETQDRRTSAQVELTRASERVGGRTRDEIDETLATARSAEKDAAANLTSSEAQLASLLTQITETAERLAPAEEMLRLRVEADRLRERGVSRAPILADAQTRLAQQTALRKELAGEPAVLAEHAQLERQLADARGLWEQVRERDALFAEQAAAQEQLAELNARQIVPVVHAANGSLAERELPTAAVLRERRQALRAERALLEAEQARQREALTHLEADDSCPTCQRDFGGPQERKTATGQLHELLAGLTDQVQEITEEAEQLERLLPQAEEVEREQQRHAKQISRVEAALAHVEARLLPFSLLDLPDRERLQCEGAALRARFDELSDQVARLRLLREQLDETLAERVRALTNEQAADSDALAALDARLQEANWSAEDVAVLRESHTQLTIEQARVEGTLPGLREQLSQAHARKEDIERERDLLRDLLAERERCHRQVLCLERLVALLAAYKSQLAAEIRPALQTIASEALRHVSDGHHQALTLSEDYEVEVECADGQILKAASLSGGERTRLALCLRLALSRLVAERTGVPLRFLVLDESLSSSDPEHIERVLEVLDGLRPIFPQVFLISHVGELREADPIDYTVSFAGGTGESRVELHYA